MFQAHFFSHGRFPQFVTAVADSDRCFSEGGRHMRSVGRWGEGAGEFRCPAGVAVAGTLLLVSEYGGARLHVLSYEEGAFLQVERREEGE